MAMTLAVTLSWASMLLHNLYELPLGVLAVENSGPLVVAFALLVAYLQAPGSTTVLALLGSWAVLNFVIGGIVTVLPLPFLPFVPEQSAGHYLAHVVYSLGQAPLLWLAYRAVVAARTAR